MDAVITYVDGLDPKHQKKMSEVLGYRMPHVNSPEFNERYMASDEICFCVASIFRFAKFIERVFIVTDDQNPFLKLPELRKYESKIQIVDHKVIFESYEDGLPSFNSNAICSLLWRIPGLSEFFIHFDDDMMLLRDVSYNDFFCNDLPRIYFHSRRRPHKRKIEDFPRRADTMVAQEMINRMFPGEPAFLPAHFPSVFSRSAFEKIFKSEKEYVLKNILCRIRGQGAFGFPPNMVHHNVLRASGLANVSFDRPGVFLGGNETQIEIAEVERIIEAENPLFLCVNDFSSTHAIAPDFCSRLRSYIFGERKDF